METMPLAGRRVLVTRAKGQASALAERITALGGEPVEVPVIAILPPESWAPLDRAVATLEQYRWVVVTSTNGAEAFAERLAAVRGAPGSGLPPGAAAPAIPPGVSVAAVGSATAKALAAAGIPVGLVPPEFRGAALPGAMAPLLRPGDRVLMPRGDLADPALADRLAELGAQVDDIVAYRTVPDNASDTAQLIRDLNAGLIHYATFTSSSTVTKLLDKLGGPAALTGVRIAVIGPETQKTAEAAGLKVHVVATKATLDGLALALAEDAAAHPQGGQNR